MVASRPEGRVACKVEVIEPEEGRSIHVRTEDRILELCQEYDAEIHAPGVGFIRSRELLADEGLPIVEAPQSVAALSAATGTFNRMLRAGLLMHDGDPVLRAHALAATMKTNEAGERYEVTDRARGLIALVMAVHGVTEYEPEPTIGLPSEAIG
jgi:phage terminase large subunit-like protein